MEEILAALVASPAFRTLVEGVAVKVVASLIHRRSVDPEFLAQSDAIFSKLSASKTDEESTHAQNDLRNLMAGN